MTRPIPQVAIDFIKSFEKLRLIPYRDSAGVWTCGWGSTGTHVVPGISWSHSDSDAYLREDLERAAGRLDRAVGNAARPLTDHQYAALISFVFNVGARQEWQIFADVRQGKLADVPTQIRRFDKATVNGVAVVLPGLSTRRLAEVGLWHTPDVCVAPRAA